MSPYKRGEVFYVEWTDDRGRRQRRASKARTKKEAELLEAELRVQSDRASKGLSVGTKNPSKLTVGEAAEKYLAGLKNDGTRKNQRFLIGKHVTRAGFGDLLLEHVTTAMIEGYLQKIEKDEEASPALVNRVRSCFSAIFRVARKLKLYHGENPAADVEQRQEPEHVERIIAPELVPSLIENAPDDDWRLVLMLAAYCGMRRGEIRRLDLTADVDLDARVLTVKQSKTGAVRRIGVHRDLVPAIKDARERGLDLSARTWRKSHLVVKEALGDPEGDAVFHGLRHTWASRLIECGAREGVVEFMGWGRRSSSTFRKHYLDFPNARLVEEIDRLSWPTEDGGDTAQIRHSKIKRVK